MTIRDLNRAMDWNLPDEEAATIAGLVIHEARAIPEPRQTFVFHGVRFEVLRRQRNRIAALRITPLAPRDPGAKALNQEGGDGDARLRGGRRQAQAGNRRLGPICAAGRRLPLPRIVAALQDLPI